MTKFFKGLVKDERGISALEYAILAGVLLAAIAVAVFAFGGQIGGWFTEAATTVGGAMDGKP